MSIPENEYWMDVFNTYQSLECLWKSTDKDFKNKHLRNAAWLKLLEKYKKVEKNGTVEKLKQKIHNIRSVYRRELKKMRESEKSGAGMDDIYIPSLWYFDTLEFLRDFETPVPGISTIRTTDELESPSTSLQCSKKSRFNAPRAEGDRSDFLKKAISHLEQVQRNRDLKDDASVYSEAWACSFRSLSSMQQIYAKQAVDEILIRGRLEKLTLNYLPPLDYTYPSYSRSATPPALSPEENSSTEIFALSDGTYAVPVITQIEDVQSESCAGHHKSVSEYIRSHKF